MLLKEQNILFFSRTMGMGGTSNVMLQLCETLQPYVKKLVVCSRGGVMTKALENMGIKHYTIPDIAVKSPAAFLNIICQVKKIIKTEEITVVHTHHRMAALYTAILSRNRKLIFINTSHNTFYDNKFLTRMAYRKANLIACGEMVKKNLVETYGLPENQITVIHNAVKPFDAAVKEDDLLKNLKEQGFILIGNVGRLTEQKGMSYFIDSLPQVLNYNSKVKYVIIGNGDEEEALRAQAQRLNVEQAVVFLGFRNDIQNIMSQLDFLVLSSLWEGLPLTPIEAFSVHKTIVATNVDGTVEIVQNGENGYLVSPENPREIADCVIDLLKNPEKRKAFEKNAFDTYRNEFSYELWQKRYLEYYKQQKL